jgi:hypothetical protein
MVTRWKMRHATMKSIARQLSNRWLFSSCPFFDATVALENAVIDLDAPAVSQRIFL